MIVSQNPADKFVPASRSIVSFAIIALLLLQNLLIISPVTALAQSASVNVVISQVYGGGGATTGTPAYKYDYVELFNRSATPASLDGYSLQYGSSNGNFSSVYAFQTGTSIGAGKYLLIKLGTITATTLGSDFTADFSYPSISMAATSGKVALANISTTLGCGSTATTAPNPCILPDARIVDLVAYGASNNGEGGTTVNNGSALDSTKGGVRKSNGCQDSNNNNNDFNVAAGSLLIPRNGNSPANPCDPTAPTPTPTASPSPTPTATPTPTPSPTPISTNLTATGAANPSTVRAGESSTLTVTVTPGTNPTSAGINVSADLSAIGGLSSQSFSTSGNNIFTFQASVTPGTVKGLKTLPVTITDNSGRAGSASINLTIAPPPASHIVISQVYGGGGNSGATYQNDFVELYNPTATTVNITGWSLQYASATGEGWDSSKQFLSGSIAPGEYFLVKLASGGATGAPLPPTNISSDINMSGTNGKIALVGNSEGLSGGVCPLGDADLVDFVGYGSASCGEGNTKTPVLSNTTAAIRKDGGRTDDDNNATDFTVAAPNPRNTAPIVEIGPRVAANDPQISGTNEPRDASITVTFSEPVYFDTAWFNIACATTGQHNDATFGISNFSRTIIITPNTSFQPGEQCSVVIKKQLVHDQDTDDAAPDTDTLPADYSWTFTVAAAVVPPYPKSVHLTMGNPSNAIAGVGEPNNYLLEKDAFALSYNRERGTPNWVSWHLDKSWITGLTREDTFRPDPEIPSDWYRVLPSDYFGTGFDRGHLTPNADRNNINLIPLNQETFLMTNMIPQAPDNNQGPWADMEGDLRKMLTDAAGSEYEIYIVAGGAGKGGSSGGTPVETIAGGRVTVPASTWKVALLLPKGEDDISRATAAAKTIAVIMPNTQGIRTTDWRTYLTTVDRVEELTGYDFFANLPDAVENSVEAGIDGSNPPGTQNQFVNVSEDNPAAITLTAASANSNPLTYTIVAQPANGMLSGSGADRVYTPNPEFSGTDSFTFRVSDGQQNSNVSTVSINVTEVNDAPIAGADAKNTNEDATLTFAAGDLSANDNAGAVNETGQTLTVTGVTSSSEMHGQVSLQNNQVSYTPAQNYNGTASFNYEVCDNGTSGGNSDVKCAQGTVTVTINSVNDAPELASIGSRTIDEDTTLTFTASAADADVPADALTYALADAPNGAIIDSQSGVFTWNAAEPGVYTFTVKVSDNGTPALADAEQITVTVSDKTPPVINNAPSNQTIEATGANGAIAVWTTPTAIDSFDGVVKVDCSQVSGAVFPIGSTTVICSAADAAGNVSTHNFTIIVRDTTAPSISIASPVNANYLLGQNVTANYNCADIASGVASCGGTAANGALIGTATTGAKTFTVTAIDNAGNTRTQTVAYTVGYAITVLFDQTKAHNSGSTIPVKLQITGAAGVNLSSASIVLTAVRVMPGNLPVNAPGNSQPANLFKYENGSYQFNLNSDKTWSAGKYELVYTISGDPLEHTVRFVIR